ncbi:MAG: flagellar FlbD family protein [Butyricicoccus sp.]|nr:flagellar FlbD family protein [Butyricicoccus sp.]
MIRLTKLNREQFLLNHMQIETIEMIPETKIIMMNHDYYIVRESPEKVVHLIQDYTAKVRDIYREISISDRREI